MAQNKTILVVEDDADVRRSLETALREAGHRVLATDTIVSGWHLFGSERPDLAILDVNLPDGTGFELCEKIRKHKELKATPVVILTAQAGYESKVSGFTAGADQYLVKPVAPSELLLWVEALLK